MSASVLFDAPGPKARARYRILTIIGALIALGLVLIVLFKFQERDQLTADKWKPFLTPSAWIDYLIPGIRGTLQAAVISIVLAAIFGLLFGMGRLSTNRPIRWISSAVVEFFRAVPVLLMMIFSFFAYVAIDPSSSFVGSLLGSTSWSSITPLLGVITGLTLYNGAVLAELVRSGVLGLPSGQREAGLSIGLTQGKTLRLILLPQALRAMLPAAIGQLVVVLKDTALGYVILYSELLRAAKQLGSANANTVPAYIVAAVIFILMNYLLTWAANKTQDRMARGGQTSAQAEAEADVEESVLIDEASKNERT